jgi:hypothetical protein
MMGKGLLSIVMIVFMAVGCSQTKNLSGNQENSCAPLKLLSGSPDSLRVDYCQIDSVYIDGDCLVLSLTYGGGCGETEFKLFRTQSVLESFPPQTSLLYSFVDNDPCRALETKTLRFDLTPFGEYARNGGIWLNLADNNRQQRVFYKH